MSHHYQHLGIFSDRVQAAREQQPLFPMAPPGSETQQQVREVLGFCNRPETPLDVQIEQHWERDGLMGEEVSWSVGYGPRTHTYVLKPAQATQPLPAVVALHCHGGFKFYGKEKIADGPTDLPTALIAYRERYYAGRAYANVLAQAGFVVLVAFKTEDRLMLLYGVLQHHQTKSYDQAVAILDELMNMDKVKAVEDWGGMTRISDYYK